MRMFHRWPLPELHDTNKSCRREPGWDFCNFQSRKGRSKASCWNSGVKQSHKFMDPATNMECERPFPPMPPAYSYPHLHWINLHQIVLWACLLFSHSHCSLRIHVCPPPSPIHLFPLTPSHQLGQTMMTDPALPQRGGSIGSVRLYFCRPFRQRMPHNQVGLALVYLVMPLNQRPPL